MTTTTKRPDPSDLTKARVTLRKRCRDKHLRDVLLRAVNHPRLVKVWFTASGVMFQGPEGIAGSHFTYSDWRAVKNLQRVLRSAGLGEER